MNWTTICLLPEEAKAWAAAFGLSAAPPVDIRITDGYRLPLGKLTLEFIHTPGHTPGAVCVLVENNLITGDTLFVGAVGRTDLPGGPWKHCSNPSKKNCSPFREKP